MAVPKADYYAPAQEAADAPVLHDHPQAPAPQVQYPPQPHLQATSDAASETTTVVPDSKPSTASAGGSNDCRWWALIEAKDGVPYSPSCPGPSSMKIRELGLEDSTSSFDSSTEFSFISDDMHEERYERNGLDDVKKTVVFTSCDGHEITVPATASTLPEAVLRGPKLLQESASVLNILFGFLGPGRHPALEKEPFEVQLAVAEAAEKYSIFSAMNFCRYMFGHILPQHSLEILAFATRHRYDELISTAAPLLLQTRLLDVLQTLPADWILPWVHYATTWHNILEKKALLINKIPSALDASHTPGCYLHPRCKTSILSLVTEMRSLSPFKGGEVGTKVIPFSHSWCICTSLLKELSDPATCLGPLFTFYDVGESASLEPGDGVDKQEIWDGSTEVKVMAEEKALEALERARQLEEEKRVEEEAHKAAGVRLEREAAARDLEMERRRLEAEEMRQSAEKEEREKVGLGDGELHLPEDKSAEAQPVQHPPASEVLLRQAPPQEETMAAPVIDKPPLQGEEPKPEDRIETLKKMQKERQAAHDAQWRKVDKRRYLLETAEAEYEHEDQALSLIHVELQYLEAEKSQAELRRLEEEKAEAIRAAREKAEILAPPVFLRGKGQIGKQPKKGKKKKKQAVSRATEQTTGVSAALLPFDSFEAGPGTYKEADVDLDPEPIVNS